MAGQPRQAQQRVRSHGDVRAGHQRPDGFDGVAFAQTDGVRRVDRQTSHAFRERCLAQGVVVENCGFNGRPIRRDDKQQINDDDGALLRSTAEAALQLKLARRHTGRVRADTYDYRDYRSTCAAVAW